VTDALLVIEIPDLAGDGWHLRPWRVDDAPSLVRAWHDPAIVDGSTPPDDRSEAAARRWIEGCEERRLAAVAFDLVIAADDDTVLGEFGLSRLDRSRRAAVVGWWLHEEARGRGIGSSALTSITTWLLAPSRLDAVVAEISPDNRGSLLMAERAGYRLARAGAGERGTDVWAAITDNRPTEPSPTAR
jgi:RimJ/RimL family protein N-acetyltransferase